ncbi:MAG: hypothetical protein ACK4ST_13780 [Elioraea tepidiphila]
MRRVFIRRAAAGGGALAHLGGGGRGGLFELLRAFLIATGGEALPFPRGGGRPGIVDRAAEAEAGAVEPHRQLADAGEAGAGGDAFAGAKVAAQLGEPGAAGLQRLDLAGGLGGRSGGEAVLETADADDPAALGDEPAHAISSCKAAIEAS